MGARALRDPPCASWCSSSASSNISKPLEDSMALRDEAWRATCHTRVPAQSLLNLSLLTWARTTR